MSCNSPVVCVGFTFLFNFNFTLFFSHLYLKIMSSFATTYKVHDLDLFGTHRCMLDLGYSLDSSTVYWPGGEGFQLCMSCSVVPLPANDLSGNEPNPGYYDYAAGVFSCAEHGGTHVDAPFHFCKSGATVDELTLPDLIGPCKVIDISEQCLRNRDYELSVADIEMFERIDGSILNERDIIVIRTGWSRYYSGGSSAYLGFDERVQSPYNPTTSALSFPGISPAAAHLLVQRKVAGVGLDTASLLLGAGIYGIENLSDAVAGLPASGAVIAVMPLEAAAPPQEWLRSATKDSKRRIE